MPQPIEPPKRRARRTEARGAEARVPPGQASAGPGEGLLDPGAFLDERRDEITLRPRSLAEYIGQERLKSNLRVYIRAARERSEPLGPVHFSGPPGLRPTTL